MKKLTIILLACFYSVISLAEDNQLADLFEQKDIKGTIVISSLNGERSFSHNDARRDSRFSTASTFKILNSMISLEEGVISGKESVLKWDGTLHEYQSWNSDQTLESAFKKSCVWCFQELARRVGPEKYRSYIEKMNYGKLKETFDATTFWLDGSLEISAKEQVDFLKGIYRRSFPFSQSSYDVLKDIMVVDESGSYTIRAKTGWAARVKPQVGWYVGYVETKDDVWFFATNIEINSKNDLVLRKSITYESLRIKGII